jgi:hypothetical protein
LVLTALALFCCTISVDTPRSPAAPAPVEAKVEAVPARPDSPSPKLVAASSSNSDVDAAAGNSAVQPAVLVPGKPAVTESYETPRQRKIWYGLMVLGHGTAAFDAWTTRQAVSGGYGVESDPTQRPFASSGAIYATTQVTPLIMDFVAHRMMRSNNPMIRKVWWIPQAASASVSLGAGLHNYSIIH